MKRKLIVCLTVIAMIIGAMALSSCSIGEIVDKINSVKNDMESMNDNLPWKDSDGGSFGYSGEEDSYDSSGTTHSHYFERNPSERCLKSPASCTKKAEYYYSCSCGELDSKTFEYGELAEHKGEQILVKRLKTHCLVYSCCYSQVSEAEEHTMVRGICSVCGFNPSITVSSAEVTSEDTQVVITISITDNPGIVGLMLSLQYNEDVFDLTEATSEEAFDALTFTSPKSFKSGCVFLWDSVEIKDEGVKSGAFLRLTFNILPNSPDGEYSILLKMSAYDNELTPFNLLIQGGKITIKNR